MISVLIKRPVAFRVPRANADGETLSKTKWRYFADEAEAEAEREANALMADYQALYVRDGTAIVTDWAPIEEALRASNSLFAAMLLEKRPDEEIEAQITENNRVLLAARGCNIS